MAQLKLIHTWTPAEMHDDEDYAAYIYSRNQNLKSIITLVEPVASESMTHIGFSVTPRFETKDLFIPQLQQRIQSMMVDVDSVREISCTRTKAISILTDKNLFKLLKHNLTALRYALLRVHFDDYPTLDTSPVDSLKKRIETECATSFSAIRYQVILSAGQYDRTLTVLPETAQMILGEEAFKQLSQHPRAAQ